MIGGKNPVVDLHELKNFDNQFIENHQGVCASLSLPSDSNRQSCVVENLNLPTLSGPHCTTP